MHFRHHNQSAIGKLGTCQNPVFSVGFEALFPILTMRHIVKDPCSLDRRRIEPLTMTVKKTILCVDDEQSLSIQKLTLETRGYRVVTCNTAVDAISIFNRRNVDLVLSNVSLPDAPATDLVMRIKALSPEIPVILLSAQTWVFQTDAPVELLLRKGTFAPAELLEHIRLLLTKRRGPRSAVPSAAARSARAC